MTDTESEGAVVVSGRKSRCPVHTRLSSVGARSSLLGCVRSRSRRSLRISGSRTVACGTDRAQSVIVPRRSGTPTLIRRRSNTVHHEPGQHTAPASIPSAGRLAYELRNELALGSLLWSGDDDRCSVAGARQGDLAARALILASQGLVAELLPTGLLFRDWSEDLGAVVDVNAWLYRQELHLPE